MKTLIVWRHAKSSHSAHDVNDHDRKLSKRGRKDAKRIGKHWRRQGCLPSFIVASTAPRAYDTAALALKKALKGASKEEKSEHILCADQRLYLSSAADHLTVLREINDDHDTAAVCGHNPALEALVYALTGEAVSMPTGSYAEIRLNIERWAELAEGGHCLKSFSFVAGAKELEEMEAQQNAQAIGEEIGRLLSGKALKRVAKTIGSRKEFLKTLAAELSKAKK